MGSRLDLPTCPHAHRALGSLPQLPPSTKEPRECVFCTFCKKIYTVEDFGVHRHNHEHKSNAEAPIFIVSRPPGSVPVSDSSRRGAQHQPAGSPVGKKIAPKRRFWPLLRGIFRRPASTVLPSTRIHNHRARVSAQFFIQFFIFVCQEERPETVQFPT